MAELISSSEKKKLHVKDIPSKKDIEIHACPLDILARLSEVRCNKIKMAANRKRERKRKASTKILKIMSRRRSGVVSLLLDRGLFLKGGEVPGPGSNQYSRNS